MENITICPRASIASYPYYTSRRVNFDYFASQRNIFEWFIATSTSVSHNIFVSCMSSFDFIIPIDPCQHRVYERVERARIQAF